MHELAITEGILKIVQKETENYDVSRILNIKLKIGELSGVVPQLIQEYFDLVSRDTVAAGAKLIVERVPVSVKCFECGGENIIDRRNVKCPVCKSTNVKIITGKEFYVDSMEVE